MTASSVRRPGLATLVLALVTAAWGSTFVLIRDLLGTIPAEDFLAVRFTIAFVAMAIVFHRPLTRLSRRDWVLGAGLGALYGVAQLLQTVGLETTPATVSGFITGTYVVLTPLFGAVLLRERVTPASVAAVVLATGGLALLSLNGAHIGYGEALTLASAAAYALHIIGLGRWSNPGRAAGLSVVQAGAVALTCWPAALLDGQVVLPSGGASWASLLYMALVAGAAALWAQTWAQAHLTATRAAIVMTLEPVFAALFAALLADERLTTRMLLGGSLVVAAMYVVELGGRGRGPADDLDGDGIVTAQESPPLEALHHEV